MKYIKKIYTSSQNFNSNFYFYLRKRFKDYVSTQHSIKSVADVNLENLDESTMDQYPNKLQPIFMKIQSLATAKLDCYYKLKEESDIYQKISKKYSCFLNEKKVQT